MATPLSSRALLTLLLAATLAGCVAKPPERPIVLRPPVSDRRQVHRAVPKRPPVDASANTARTAPVDPVVATAISPSTPGEPPAARTTLTPDQKNSLFEAFDQYLTQTGRPQ